MNANFYTCEYLQIAQQTLYVLCSDGHLHRRYSVSFLTVHTIRFSLFLCFVRKVPGSNSVHHFGSPVWEFIWALRENTWMEHWWNYTGRGKTDVLGDKPVPLPLNPPLKQHTLIWDRTRTSAMTDLRLTKFLKQKCLFIAPFQITKGYTFIAAGAWRWSLTPF